MRRRSSRDPDFLIRYATSGVMVVPRAFSGGGDARGDRYPGHRVVPVMPGVGPTPYRARSTVSVIRLIWQVKDPSARYDAHAVATTPPKVPVTPHASPLLGQNPQHTHARSQLQLYTCQVGPRRRPLTRSYGQFVRIRSKRSSWITTRPPERKRPTLSPPVLMELACLVGTRNLKVNIQCCHPLTNHAGSPLACKCLRALSTSH